MKSKPCKQSLHSLRTSSRKSDLAWLILVLTFVCSPNRIFPQKIHLDAQQLGEGVNISARLESIPYKEVFTSLQDGLEAEITFQFRLYEKVRGVFAIFGDRLIGQREPSYRAHMKLYDNTYTLITSSGEKLEFKKREDFVKSFFHGSSTSALIRQYFVHLNHHNFVVIGNIFLIFCFYISFLYRLYCKIE